MENLIDTNEVVHNLLEMDIGDESQITNPRTGKTISLKRIS